MHVFDDFNRADAPVGAAYVNSLISAPGVVSVLSNRVSWSNTAGSYAHRVETFSEDHGARLTIVNLTSTAFEFGYISVLVRSSGIGATWAGYQLACLTPQVELFAFWNGTGAAASLGVYGGVTTGDVIELRARGATIEYWKNGALVDTVPENVNVPRSGSAPGLAGYIATQTGDDFYGDDLDVTPPTPDSLNYLVTSLPVGFRGRRR